jgi:hypothetical protein
MSAINLQVGRGGRRIAAIRGEDFLRREREKSKCNLRGECACDK